MQDFYENGDGWNQEVLCQLDNALTAWRKIASRHNRGIQERSLAAHVNDVSGSR